MLLLKLMLYCNLSAGTYLLSGRGYLLSGRGYLLSGRGYLLSGRGYLLSRGGGCAGGAGDRMGSKTNATFLGAITLKFWKSSLPSA
jgi:hypothetical protein